MIARLLLGLVRLWQLGPSAVIAPTCRYAPSCSAYAAESLAKHGAWRGTLLTARRIARCHPWGGSGYDPVPSSLERLPK